MAKLKIVIVTPETTTLDQEADFVVLPMFDGESGISANHAPMIGRLGPGELRVKDGNNTCLLYTSPSPRDRQKSRMPSSA